MLGQLDAPPAPQRRLGVIGHPGVGLGVEAEQVGEDLAVPEPGEDVDEVAVGLAEPDERVAVDLPGAEDLPGVVDDLPVFGPRQAGPAGRHVGADAAEQVLGHGIEPDADHVDADGLEALELGAVERRRRHQDRQRCIDPLDDAGGDVEGVTVGVGVRHHRDAQPGHPVGAGGHAVDELVGADQRPLDPDERLVLVGTRAGAGEPAVAAVGAAAVLVVEQEVDAAEVEVAGETARPEPQGDGRGHRDPDALGALLDPARPQATRRDGHRCNRHAAPSGK